MENNETKPPRKKTLPIIFGTLILIGLIYGIIKYRYSLSHEVTDDAQIEGDISPVLARVSGYVSKILFEENQLVRKGDTLLIIDDSDFRIRVQQADAALQNASASVYVAKANVISAQASEEVAKSGVESAKIRVWKATQEFNRYQNLLNDSAVTQQQYDNIKAEKEGAEASLNAAIKQQSAASAISEASEKQIAVAQSVVAQKQADLDYAKLQLTYAIVKSPASGFASRKNVQPGQLVNAGSPLFSIVSDSGIYIVANYKETQVGKMNLGNSVEVKVDAYSDRVFEGSVYSFSPATGAKFSLLPPDNATGNFVKVVQRLPVKIVIKAEKDILSRLHPGMSVKVAVKTD